MTVLIVGSRPPTFSRAVGRLGIEYDVVYDPVETLRAPEVMPRRVHWLPYVSAPESVLELPDLDRYDGVVSFVEFGVTSAALVASVCGLPGTPVDAVLRTKNKYLMRKALGRAGLAQPAFGMVGHDEPKPEHYPLVVKPVDGTASSGVRLVAAATELKVIPPGRTMMWESHLEGPQYTVEGLAGAEGHRALAITGKVVSGPPHFIVHEHETPADVDPATARLITDYAAACLAALGVRHAATHTEIALHHGEPMLIETHTRPASDRVPYLTQLTTGWDQCELALAEVSTTGLRASAHPVTNPFARTIHFTPYDSDRAALADPGWLADYPEVVFHDVSRIFANRSATHDSRGGYDPRWASVVLAGPDRDALRETGERIRARAR
ncbi:ATP-grasp domain-containing protein [Amycolatopsis nigrescens]|uniref:ATP-grasp domain-containing protein n=1 Tax=Amycolatopsis nigrescens TaxID=381445 RepID=UPI0003A4797B|nr:ATP-grasp domain-containing protein [Amycolatopsis nigrescens]